MQVNHVLKGLAMALPMLTLVACSSNNSATQSETQGETQSEMQNSAPENTGTSDVTLVTPVDGLQGSLTEEELRDSELRQSHIVMFEYDTYAVLPQYSEMLDAHAQFLLENPKINVVVEGHADERGTPEYNISLGERRANAVAKYLQALGIPAAQISIVSYGEEKPIDLGHGENAYAKNRRAVLVY